MDPVHVETGRGTIILRKQVKAFGAVAEGGGEAGGNQGKVG